MKKTMFFIISLFVFSSFADTSTVPESTLKIGQEDTNTKEIILNDDTGTPAKIESDAAGTISINKDVDVSGSVTATQIEIGDGTDSDTSIVSKQSATSPSIKYSSAQGSWVFDNGDSLEKRFGSGSGSGGGDNYNNAFESDDNPDAELGTQNWTHSAGTFVVTESGTKKLFTFTPTATGDKVESGLVSLDSIVFHGNSCQVQISYIGGDGNYTLKVVDGNGDELELITNSSALQEHKYYANEGFSFICPTQAAITGDANKGQVKLVIENTGVSAGAAINFNKAYIGTLIGLSEAVLPDTFGGYYSDGDGALVREWGGILDGCSNDSTGIFTCSYNTTFTYPPSCSVEVNTGGTSSKSTSTSVGTSSVTVRIFESGALADFSFSISCNKLEEEAKQQSQVYKLIPTAAQNENKFTAYIMTDGTVTREGVDWINGDAAVSDTSLYTITFTEPFEEDAICGALINNSTTGVMAQAKVTTDVVTSSVTVRTGYSNTSSSFVKNAYNFKLFCSRATNKTPTVQPIVVGQVRNSYAESASKNFKTEFCGVSASSGTPTSGSSFCSPWVSSFTDLGTGVYQVNFNSGQWLINPTCTCTVNDNYPRVCTAYAPNTSYVVVRTNETASESYIDRDFSISCKGY